MALLTRDARHLALTQVGRAGQERFAAASVLLVGAGGIGCAVGTYLASAGVGRIVICDFDTVDETNLGRQVLYRASDVGRLKAEVAAIRLQEQNPEIDVQAITERLQGERLASAVQDSKLVLDGTDNFATRFDVNAACIAAKRRLISGSAIRLEGQIAVFGPDYDESPCYQCLYAEADESLESCAGNGVLAPVPAVIGTLMAVDALKYLANVESESGVLRLYDAVTTEMRQIAIAKRNNCESCAG